MFCGFLWSPIFSHYLDILTELNVNYQIYDFKIYDFKDNKKEYESSILDIYSTDDIKISKIKNIKIKNMLNYKYTFIFFHIKIKNPNYRIKKQFNTKISQEVEKIKLKIRNKYKKIIKNYIHDIIIHVCDNLDQSSQIEILIKKYDSFLKNHFMNTKVFLKYQFNKDIFTRVDMLVRKYSIEQYFKNKNYDFALYNKMQKLRINKSNLHLNFINLINSIEKNNFDYNFPIEYESNFLLRNGSHRLSYCYYKQYLFIPISTLNNYKSEGNAFCNYSFKWFKDKFLNNELNIIINELNLFKKYLSS